MSASNPKLFSVGELSIGAESDFNVETGSYQHVRCLTCDVSGLEAVALDDLHMKQGDYQVTKLMGPKRGTITTTHQLHGWTATTDPAEASIADPPGDGIDMLMSVIGSAVGGIIVGGKATDISASTASAITCTTTSFTVGQGVAWAGTEGGTRMGWVKTIAGGDVTLLQTVDDGSGTTEDHTPGSSGSLYGGYTMYKTTGSAYHDNASSHESFSLQFKGHETDDKITATGALPTGLTMSFPIGELPTITVTWSVAGWSEVGSGGLGNGVAPSTWAAASPEAVMSGWVTRGSSAGEAGLLRIASLELDLQISRPPVADPNETNGIGGFGPLQTIPKVNFSVFRSDTAVDKFFDQTEEAYTFVFGSNPGSMIGLCIPSGFVTQYPAKSESDAAVTSEFEIYCSTYDGDTGSTPANQSTPIDSDFRISFC